MSRSASARKAAREKTAAVSVAEDLLAQLAALGGGAFPEFHDHTGQDDGPVVDEKELIRQIGALDDDDELASFIATLDESSGTAEDAVLKQLEATLRDGGAQAAQGGELDPGARDNEALLLRQLAELMGEAAPGDAGDTEEVAAAEIPAARPSKPVASVPALPSPNSLRTQLLDAKRQAVALKREGRITEARAALAEVKRLQALVDSNGM
jgi:hypothetical protein